MLDCLMGIFAQPAPGVLSGLVDPACLTPGTDLVISYLNLKAFGVKTLSMNLPRILRTCEMRILNDKYVLLDRPEVYSLAVI